MQANVSTENTIVTATKCRIFTGNTDSTLRSLDRVTEFFVDWLEARAYCLVLDNNSNEQVREWSEVSPPDLGIS
jgi:hypothetical protein